MKGEAWISLLQRIPTSYHDSLVVLLSAGAELVLQTIVSLEPDYMIIRGRTAGSTDGGRVFLVPFDQIEYMGFLRRVSEAELQGLFGADAPAFAAGAPAAGLSTAALPPADAAPAVEVPDPESAPKKPAQISKSILLARLRARLSQDGKP